MPFIDINTGVRLHYEDSSGEKTPFILVHGLLGTTQMHYSRVMDWLKDDYRIYGITMRGFGLSRPPQRDFPLDFYQRDTNDLIAFMDALNIEKAHLLGYSDGGEVALLAGAQAPERFLSVMTIGAVGYFGPAMRPVVQRMYPADWITPEEREAHGIEDVNAFVLPWIQSMKSIIDSGGDLSVSSAHQIIAPLLMMLGHRDTLNPAEYAQKIIDRAPNGRLEMFNAGHSVHDDAWEDFKRIVTGFLAEIDQ